MTTAFKIVGSDHGAQRDPAQGAFGTTFDDAADVALRLAPEAPTFCYSAEIVQSRAQTFLSKFPGEVAYAVKANSDPDVLATVAACGIDTFDVASVEEMALVRSLAPRAVLHYHNPVKSRSEIAKAYRFYGCRRFAADHPDELAKIAAVVGDAPGIEIAVRFRLTTNGDSAHDFSTKFGATPEEAADLLRQVVAAGFVPLLTFHPGSQGLKPSAYARHIREAARIAESAGVALAVLNVGGGFPARYLASDVPPLEDYFRAIDTAADEAFGLARPDLECEPGRGLVAPAVSLLTRVKLVKHARQEIYINDGVYGALMEVNQMPCLLPRYRVIRDGATMAGQTAPFVLYGPTCDPIDRFPVELDLPVDIAEDDYIEFDTLGAYGSATATRFNGYDSRETVPVRRIFDGC
ncbi:MAG: type III PLP-dependent enzyme [Hyphomicrobiales bacterium]